MIVSLSNLLMIVVIYVLFATNEQKMPFLFAYIK